MARTACILVCLTLWCAPATRGQEEAPDPWPELKVSWAGEHLELAGDMLKLGAIGFADAQAGLARQLVGAEHELLAEYPNRREGAIATSKRGLAPWLEKSWKLYQGKRLKLYRNHAAQAMNLLGDETPEERVQEIQGWVLRLDPDSKELRAQRGEKLVPGLGWLPEETARAVGKGLVLVGGEWGKARPGKKTTWQEAHELPSEHFRLRTTLPVKEAQELAAELEGLWHLWQQILEGVLPLPAGEEPPVVWILRTRTDYQACVADRSPGDVSLSQDQGTAGFARRDVAFFCQEIPPRATNSMRSTMFHEVTHLLHNRLTDTRSNTRTGIWCIEGLAVAMEGLHRAKVVDWNAAVPLKTNPYHPGLARLQGLDGSFLDQNQAQFAAGDAPMQYTRALAYAHYLLYAEGGRLREALLGYLLDVMPGDASRETYDEHFPELPREVLAQRVLAHVQ